jgi:hypothetical protein
MIDPTFSNNQPIKNIYTRTISSQGLPCSNNGHNGHDAEGYSLQEKKLDMVAKIQQLAF